MWQVIPLLSIPITLPVSKNKINLTYLSALSAFFTMFLLYHPISILKESHNTKDRGLQDTLDLQETTQLTLFCAGTLVILFVIYQLEHYMLRSFHPANEPAFSQQKESTGESQIQRLTGTNQTNRYIEHLNTP
jgi:ABC-type maltose transport system permease subunit